MSFRIFRIDIHIIPLNNTSFVTGIKLIQRNLQGSLIDASSVYQWETQTCPGVQVCLSMITKLIPAKPTHEKPSIQFTRDPYLKQNFNSRILPLHGPWAREYNTISFPGIWLYKRNYPIVLYENHIFCSWWRDEARWGFYVTGCLFCVSYAQQYWWY